MQQESSSIFNQDFIEETWIRRRDLMPLGLKILVWFFLVITTISLIIRCYFFLKYQSGLDLGAAYGITTFFKTGDFLFSVLEIAVYLFILFEMKPAILFALIIAGIALLLGLYSFVSFWSSGLHYSLVIMDVGKCVLQGFFFMMLFRIKKDWETKALSGRELRANKSNS